MSHLTGRPPYQKGRKLVSQPLRNATAAQTCTLRIPGVCNGDTAKVVACHLRHFGAAGMGEKPSDLFMVDGCSDCHDALDSRHKWADLGIGYDDLLRALMETQSRRLMAGLITVKE